MRPKPSLQLVCAFLKCSSLPNQSPKANLHRTLISSELSAKKSPLLTVGYLFSVCRSKFNVLSGIVVEDAPTGIRSGKASGAFVLATCTSHTRESLEKENPDFLVTDLSQCVFLFLS